MIAAILLSAVFSRAQVTLKADGPGNTYQLIESKGFGIESPDCGGQTAWYRWKCRLDAPFRPSSRFTHIFQVKAIDGDAGAPSPRRPMAPASRRVPVLPSTLLPQMQMALLPQLYCG